MNDQTNPEHGEFADETAELFQMLEDMVEDLEENPDTAVLEVFAGSIAELKKLAILSQANTIANYCKLCHFIATQSTKEHYQDLVQISAPILIDAFDLIKEMKENFCAGKGEGIEQINTEAFAGRLNWLAEKFQGMEEKAKESSEEMDGATTAELDSLLGDLGL